MSKPAKHTPIDAGNISTWEMDDYYGNNGNKNDMTTTAYGGDESGSERRLTMQQASAVPKDMIVSQPQCAFSSQINMSQE